MRGPGSPTASMAAAVPPAGPGSLSPRTWMPAPSPTVAWERREAIVLRPGHSEVMIGAAAGLLVLLGLVMVFNTSYFYAQERFGDPYLFTRKHAVSAALGAMLALAARRVPSRAWRRLAWPLLLVVIAGLAAVLVPGIGIVRGGARRWIELGGVTAQPSEAAKLAIALWLAHAATRKGERIRTFWTGYLPHLVIVGLCVGLVVVEPDFGTAVLLASFLLLMLFAAGARWPHLAGTTAVGLVAVGFGALFAQYRMQRLMTFLDPWRDPQASGFQLVQSLLAFGAGGLWGVGLGAGRQKMHYLPEAHTDFVFAVIGEELGLAGTLGVIAIFACLGVGGYRLIRRHPDPFAGMLAFALTSMILLQAAVNMAVAVGLLPTKGLTLPFLSYGGSALLVNMTEIGILLGIAREAR